MSRSILISLVLLIAGCAHHHENHALDTAVNDTGRVVQAYSEIASQSAQTSATRRSYFASQNLDYSK